MIVKTRIAGLCRTCQSWCIVSLFWRVSSHISNHSEYINLQPWHANTNSMCFCQVRKRRASRKEASHTSHENKWLITKCATTCHNISPVTVRTGFVFLRCTGNGHCHSTIITPDYCTASAAYSSATKSEGRFKVSQKCKLLNGQATHGSLPDLGVLNSKKVNQSITVHTPSNRIHMDTHTTTTHHCIPNDSECVCLIGFLLPLLLLLHPLVKLFLLLLPCPEGSF